MYPPAVARRLADACQSSVHVYTLQVHNSFSDNETPSANALQRVERCCCCQAHADKVLVAVPFHHRPQIHQPVRPHLWDGTCVAKSD